MDIKKLKKYDQFISEKINDISDLEYIAEWIKSFWERINNLPSDEIFSVFEKIEEKFGKEIANIIDSVYSADRLHYYQSGSTVSTGGVDTGEFIRNFDNIKKEVDSIIDDKLSLIGENLFINENVDENVDEDEEEEESHDKIKNAENVCHSCGVKYGTPLGHDRQTWTVDNCDICDDNTEVTNVRHFSNLDKFRNEN